MDKFGKPMAVQVVSAIEKKEVVIQWKFVGEQSEFFNHHLGTKSNSLTNSLKMPLTPEVSFTASLFSKKVPKDPDFHDYHVADVHMAACHDEEFDIDQALDELLQPLVFVVFELKNDSQGTGGELDIVFKINGYSQGADSKNNPNIFQFKIKTRRETISVNNPLIIESPTFEVPAKGKGFEIILRVEESKLQNFPMPNKSEDSVTTYLTGMHNDDETKDIELVIGDTTFKAHKFVLVANSTVFRAMFQHNLKEKQEASIKIDDTNVETFRVFLKYLYTRQIDNVNDVTEDLMILADKYDVQSLKDNCDTLLSFSMTPEIAINSWIKAHLCNAPALKETAVKVIKQNFDEIQKSENLMQMFNAYPDLLKDISSQ